MKSDQAATEEVAEGESPFCPAVIVGIPYNEAREYEEEVHCQIAVVEKLVGGIGGKAFAHVENHYKQRSHSAQSVENMKMRFLFP